MRTIPLQAVSSQTLSAVLANQNCQIAVYQKTTGLYFDLSVNNAPIVTTKLCRDRVKLVRQEYLGFDGDLAFVDTQGRDDPEYAGLGSRFVLVYLPASSL